jgi:hypothetical protein
MFLLSGCDGLGETNKVKLVFQDWLKKLSGTSTAETVISHNPNFVLALVNSALGKWGPTSDDMFVHRRLSRYETGNCPENHQSQSHARGIAFCLAGKNIWHEFIRFDSFNSVL